MNFLMRILGYKNKNKMRKLKKITTTQKALHEQLVKLAAGKQLSFEGFKNISGFKSFDGSFNALLKAGWVKRIGIDNLFELVIPDGIPSLSSEQKVNVALNAWANL